jgi:uncharacterized protein (TIGR03435 family)
MKMAQPDEPVPAGAVRFEGGWMVPVPSGPNAKQSVIFLQVTMAEFTTSFFRDPILNATGLRAKYDFELPRLDMTLPETVDGSAPPSGPPDSAHMFDWSAIGLEMKPAKVPANNVVVDHIERPSEN